MAQRGKTIVYFDNSNIFYSQKNAGWRIDVEKLQARLEQDGSIWQVYFFGAATEPPRYMQTVFYRMLKEKLRWETLILPLGQKTVRCSKCSQIRRAYTEKGVDVAIATRMLTHAIHKAFETAVLISGDKDYLETVKIIKDMGLRVEIVAFRKSLSIELARESSAPILYLDDIRSDIELFRPDSEAEALSTGDDT